MCVDSLSLQLGFYDIPSIEVSREIPNGVLVGASCDLKPNGSCYPPCFPASFAYGAEIGMESRLVISVDFPHVLPQFRCRDDDKIRLSALEALQHENPIIGFRRVKFRPVQREPACTAEFLPYLSNLFFWQEVLPVLDLQRDSAAVLGIGDKQVNADVLGRYPCVQFQGLLDVKTSEIFTRVDGKQRPHWRLIWLVVLIHRVVYKSY